MGFLLLHEFPSNHRNIPSMCTIQWLWNTKTEFSINNFPPGFVEEKDFLSFTIQKQERDYLLLLGYRYYKENVEFKLNWWKIECKVDYLQLNGGFCKTKMRVLCEILKSNEAMQTKFAVKLFPFTKIDTERILWKAELKLHSTLKSVLSAPGENVEVEEKKREEIDVWENPHESLLNCLGFLNSLTVLLIIRISPQNIDRHHKLWCSIFFTITK